MKKSYQNRIKVLIVDDHSLFRRGLEVLLANECDEIEVIGSVGDGKKAVEFCKKNKVDVILMDIEMPIMSGIEATQKILAANPNQKILILSMHDDEEMILHLIEKGAKGFLSKSADVDEIINAIFSINENGYYFNDKMSKVLLSGLIGKISTRKVHANLTDKEIEIIKLIANEFTVREIAEKLDVSTRTIDNYRERILEKTGAKNTVGIVMYAIKHELIDVK